MDAHTARENAASGRAKERKWNVLNEHEGGVILSGTSLYSSKVQKRRQGRTLSPFDRI